MQDGAAGRQAAADQREEAERLWTVDVSAGAWRSRWLQHHTVVSAGTLPIIPRVFESNPHVKRDAGGSSASAPSDPPSDGPNGTKKSPKTKKR